MRRVLLVLVAALALAVGINASAVAADGGTQAAAKKKAAKCKAKPKPKPKSPTGATLTDGHYEDAANELRVTVSGGGTKLELGFPTSCFLFSSETVPIRRSGDVATAAFDGEIILAGIPGHVSWELTVKPGLKYTIAADFRVEVCRQTLPARSGVLKKKD